jgi:ADP-heptose:LPS heptosyltransferase
MMLAYMREQMGLHQVSAHVSISPPEELAYRRYPKRILVSPDSAWPEKKDWSAQGFMRVCGMLDHKGFQPVIIVAPHNHRQWMQRSSGRYEVPRFDSIAELAAYIYESGALIANDSGNAHLASFLNIPVVTIYRKSNPNYHWRPGWRTGRVICPRMVLPALNGRRIWRPFIRPEAVCKAVIDMLAQAKSETET